MQATVENLFVRDEICTKERLTELLEEGLDRDQIASVLDVWPDTVTRALRRHELIPPAEPARRVTPEIRRRILVLGAEGMPCPWIAEDVQLSEDTVKRVLGPRPEAALEWRRAWSGIRHKDELYSLHCTFTAPSRKNGLTRDGS